MGKSTPEKILNAALQLMASKPIASLTFREIAAEAGISHMAPYRHFKSRLEVFARIAEAGHAMLGSRLSRLIEEHPVDPEKQILGAGEVYYDFSQEFPEHFKLMFMESLLDKIKDPPASLITAARSSHSVFLTMIHNAQMKKLISGKLEPKAIAFLFWSSVHGATVLNQSLDLKSTIGSVDVRKSIQNAICVILSGLGN